MLSAFVHELMAGAEAGRDIVLVLGDDPVCSSLEAFASRFPRRFFKAGPGIQNLVGLAAGLASEGFLVFVHAGAEAALLRCAEQIHENIAAHRLPVTLVAAEGRGQPAGFHDYALLRLMPELLIAAPGDCLEARACIRRLLVQPQPACLFLGEAATVERQAEPPPVEPGHWLPVLAGRPGGRATLLATGGSLAAALRLAAGAEYRDCAVHSLPLWGMGYERLQAAQIEAWDSVVVVEGLRHAGGFASWLLESAAERPDLLARVQRFASPSAERRLRGWAPTLEAGRP